MKTFFRILSFAKPLTVLAPLYVFLIVCAIVFNILNFTALVPILNIIFGEAGEKIELVKELPEFEMTTEYFSALGKYAVSYLMNSEESRLVLLKRVCVGLVISVFLSNLFSFFAQMVLSIIRTRIILNLRNQTFNKILALPISYFGTEKKGDIMSRMTNDVQEVESTGVNIFNVIIKEPLTVMILFGALIIISPKLTLFTAVILPLTGVVIGQLTKRLRKKSGQSQASLGGILGQIEEAISGIRIIKAFNGEGYISKKFRNASQRYGRIFFSMDYKRAMASPISQFLGVSVVAVIMYVGGSMVLSNDQTISLRPTEFLSFILLYGQVVAPLKSITNAFSNMQRGIVSAERIFSVLDSPLQIEDKPNAQKLQSFDSEIKFEGLFFKYETDWVLKGIDLTVTKGQMVALVGPSGGGKSTLMNLVPRFHDPQQGGVTIDGIDLRDVTMASLRDQLGVVTQEAVLFNDTVFNNIAFGIDASQEEVEQAAKIANAHEFIVKLEKGYETEVGDRGMKLSGGQRQRLTIARAILANPPILLLDEATSALDSESEHLVQEALMNLMKNRTSIVIAHRLSTIQHADVIIVLKDGQVAERGTHDELVNKDGVYRRLHEMQSLH